MDTAELQPSAAAEPAEGDKLDQIINSAYDSVEAENAAPEESQQETADRLRDERGRFAAKNPAEAEPSTQEPATAEATPVEAQPVEPAQQPLEPHPRWSDTDKAKFGTLPRDAQEFLLAREKMTEADYTRKTQEIAEQRKSIEPLIGEVTRLNPLFQHLGMTPQQFVAESATVAHNLLSGTPEQRANAVAYLVNLHGVPPQAVIQALGIPLHSGEDGQTSANPQFANLSQTITQLERKLYQIETQAQNEQRSRAEHEFNALAHAKDDNGQQKYPHFERVKQAMLQLAANGQADTWDAAYTKATRLDDDLHKEVIEAAAKREREALEKQRQESVEKAKRAQPIRESNSAPRGDAGKKGLDNHIDAALSRAGF
jgi:hypothetical protein